VTIARVYIATFDAKQVASLVRSSQKIKLMMIAPKGESAYATKIA